MIKYLMFVCLLALNTPGAGAERFTIAYEKGRVVKRYPERSHPVIGLALSGGGARGIAHIGVLEVLEQLGIRPERIAGTSMGSIIGGLYASGYTLQVITSMLESNVVPDILSSDPKRRNVYIGQKEINQWPLIDVRFEGLRAIFLPSSLSSGQKFTSLLSWLTLGPMYECGGDFDRLPIPFRTVATNCVTGNAKVLGSGNLARAIQASSTIPGLFAPVEWEDTLLVDGGLTNNLPVNVAREMGSDFVIAVSIDESMHSQEELKNPFNMADQVTSIPIRNVTAVSKHLADFVISPNMDGFSSKNFSPIREIIERGHRAALDSIPALTAALKKAQANSRAVTIRSVACSPAEEGMYIAAILAKSIVPGKTVSYAEIARSLEELWDTGRYFRIDADVDEGAGGLSLEVVRTPGTAVIRIPGNQDQFIEETVEEVSPDENGRFSMHELIERINARIRLIRTENSRSTLASITSEELSETGDTLRLTVTAPRLTGIFIEKNLKSRRYLITREIDMEIGEPFDLNKAMNSIENLYGTNLFEQVYADVSPHEGGVGFRIHLQEKNWSVVRLGIKYDDFNATEGRVNLSRDNMFGLGNQMNVTLQSGQRTKMFMVENRNDRIYKWMYTFNLRAYKHIRMRPLYDRASLMSNYEDDRYGVILSVGEVMDKLGNVVVQLKSETSLIHYPPSLLMKNTRHSYHSIIVRSLIDSYDQYPFPRNGMLNILYIENAGKVFGGTEQFVKIFWGSTVTKTFSRRHTVTGALSLGTADPSLPKTEMFALGGIGTRLNCYNPDTAASLFYADFTGLRHEQRVGSRLAAGRLSYRLFIPRYFYLELTYGAGNVWRSGETIRVDSLLQCYGIRGTFDTYIGQLGLGWGITSRGDDRLYMSAGREF